MGSWTPLRQSHKFRADIPPVGTCPRRPAPPTRPPSPRLFCQPFPWVQVPNTNSRGMDMAGRHLLGPQETSTVVPSRRDALLREGAKSFCGHLRNIRHLVRGTLGRRAAWPIQRPWEAAPEAGHGCRPDAFTRATMPARIAEGRSGHAATIYANLGIGGSFGDRLQCRIADRMAGGRATPLRNPCTYRAGGLVSLPVSAPRPSC
jgi:hypothetical protein